MSFCEGYWKWMLLLLLKEELKTLLYSSDGRFILKESSSSGIE